MNWNQSTKMSLLIHHWLFWLMIITFIGIFLRMLPSLLNAAWGVDFGIYYGLTNSFIETKEFINFYDGWGSSYQYFPVLYTITGVVHWITGIEVIQLMPKIAPILGGLTIPIFYFIVKDLIGNKRIAILASALLSVSTFHVYQTSHAAPLTVGHFFMMLSFYFFIKYVKDQKYIIPLFFSTVLLILSHHFTTYFYLISITFMVFYYTTEKHVRSKHLYHLLFYIGLAATLAFGYWGFIATPVFGFFTNKMFLPPTVIILLFYAFIFSGVLFIRFWKKQYPDFLQRQFFKNYSKEKTITIMVLLIGILSIIVSITGLPGVKASLTPLALILSIPMMFLISFGIAGFSFLKAQKGHAFVKGWIIGIFISFLYAIVSGGLFPDRHLEYLIVPLCIPAALTLNEFIKDYQDSRIKNIFNKYTPSMQTVHRKKKIALIGSIIILFISNMIVAYPTIDSLEHIDERVSDPCINCLDWMQGNMSNSSVIASDHRILMLTWATGFDMPLGEYNITKTIWTANNSSACFEELQRLKINHVIIDDIMFEKVINVDDGHYYYFNNNSYEKFLKPPFELIYRNATLNNQLVEEHWIEIYKVNYSQFKK